MDATPGQFDIEVRTSSDHKGKGATLFVVNRKAEAVDPCLGAESRGFPALLFMRETNAGSVISRGMFLTESSGTCEQQIGSNPYVRNVSLYYDPSSRTGAMVHDADGFGLVSIGSPQISPDGTALLVHGVYESSSMGYFHAGWSCSFSGATATVDRQGCSNVYGWLAGSRTAPELGWSADGQSLYVTQGAQSGSGSALYRLRLADGASCDFGVAAH